MSWTTVVDLPMRRYQGNEALDHSGFANNATIVGVPTQYPGYVTLDGADDHLAVPSQTDSLQRFAGLRISARIRPTALPHRLNVVEGSMAFAFMVEANGFLRATIYDGRDWVPVDSSQPVPMNQWSDVTFEYDGISIGKLTQDGALVGRRIDMPMGMRQPSQVIAIGHWPIQGDHRYSFVGDMGHVRIDRRDHEDAWRDALRSLLCTCPMTPRQAAAVAEMTDILNAMEPARLKAFIDCWTAEHQKIRALVRRLRAEDLRNIVRFREAGTAMREAWCCGTGLSGAKEALRKALEEIAGAPGSEERAAFGRNVQEFLDIGKTCRGKGRDFDRLYELGRIIMPRLVDVDRQLIDLLREVEEAS